MKKPEYLIVGAGPVGLILSLLLAKQNKSSHLLELRKKNDAHSDRRALALSYGTKIILENLGIWGLLKKKVTEIESIHTSQKNSFGRTLLSAHEYNLPALGYVVSYGDLSKALENEINKYSLIKITYEFEVSTIKNDKNKSILYGLNKDLPIETLLLILADGGKNTADLIQGLKRKETSYNHTALVTKVISEIPPNKVAYERFTSMGPIALLPNGPKEFSLVWTGEDSVINGLAKTTKDMFLKKLHEHFGERVGEFVDCDKFITFPLKKITLEEFPKSHMVIIGNSAQTMHPVAGQGFNTGIRDAYELSKLINESELSYVGSEAFINQYYVSRQLETKKTLFFTDSLINIFSNDLVGLSAVRGISLSLLDNFQPIKNFLVTKMSFGK
ncbi:MAG: 2-octaprenyl-6-methoxyphenyl hydroxylase [Candidatus Methylopumilus sp.]|nr:2-octaprenyl-6-methoxyphenyl hydroxylase [Candidatus Methylopumilus sp.]